MPLRILLICFLILSACAKPIPKTALSPERRLEAERLLRELRSQSSLHSMSSLVQVSVESRGKRELFDAAILLEAPNRVRIEIIDDLGQTLSRLTADGSQVLWYDAKEDGYVLIPQEPDALKKLLRLPITVEEFIARLLLRIPEGTILEAAQLEGSGWEILREEDRMIVRLKPLGLESFQKKPPRGSKFLYQVAYEPNPIPANYPPGLQWKFLKPGVHLTMRMSEPRLNPTIPADRFDTTPPPGARLGKIH